MPAAGQPDLYTDHNVSLRLAERLRGRGFSLTTTRELGLERATDAKQLLTAAQRGWLVLTHNERDFVLLFDAWRRWADAWGIGPHHAGIVVLPQWEAPVAEAMLLTLFGQTRTFTDSLYRWQAADGWLPLAYIP